MRKLFGIYQNKLKIGRLKNKILTINKELPLKHVHDLVLEPNNNFNIIPQT